MIVNKNKIQRTKTMFRVGDEEQVMELINISKAPVRKKKYDQNVLKQENFKLKNMIKFFMKDIIKSEKKLETENITNKIKKETEVRRRSESTKLSVPDSKSKEKGSNKIIVKSSKNLKNATMKEKNVNKPFLVVPNDDAAEMSTDLLMNNNSSLIMNNEKKEKIDISSDSSSGTVNKSKKEVININRQSLANTIISLIGDKMNDDISENKNENEDQEIVKFKAKDYLKILKAEGLFCNSEYKDEDFSEVINGVNESLSNQTLHALERADRFSRGLSSLEENSPTIIQNYDHVDDSNDIEKRKLKKMNKLLSDSLSEEEEFLHNEENDLETGFVILPDSKFKVTWDLILGIFTLYSMIITPFIIAFDQSKFYGYLMLDVVMDTFFILDVILNFFVPFYNFEETLIKSKRKIAINYIKSWFLLDVLACIPTGSITGLVNYYMLKSDSKNKILSLNQTARFGKFYRVIKITQLFKILKIANKDKIKYIQSINIFEDMNISSALRRLFKFFVGFLIVSHVVSCIWIFFGSLENPNWIYVNNYVDNSNLDLYLYSIYFIWSTIFTIGYGDIIPVNSAERFFTILLMFIGILTYSFVVSALGNILTNKDVITKKYITSLEILHAIKRKHHVPDEFYDKVVKYLHYNYKFNKNEKFNFINDIPLRLKNNLLHNMYRDIITNFKFLKFENEDFKSKVVLSLRPAFSIKGEYIIVENEYIEEFLLMRRGMLSVNLGSKYDEVKIIEIRKYEHFGDILMMAQQKSPVNVRVITKNADLFLIKKKDLIDISLQFPEIFDKIFLISTYNYLIMLELIEERIDKIEKEKEKNEFIFSQDLNTLEIRRTLANHTVYSSSTLEKTNPNLKAVNDFKKINRDAIENAKKFIQEMKLVSEKKFKNNSNKTINENIDNILQSSCRKMSEETGTIKMKKNLSRLDPLHRSSKTQVIQDCDIKKGEQLLTVSNISPSMNNDNIICSSKNSVNLINFNFIIQNNNFVSSPEKSTNNITKQIIENSPNINFKESTTAVNNIDLSSIPSDKFNLEMNKMKESNYVNQNLNNTVNVNTKQIYKYSVINTNNSEKSRTEAEKPRKNNSSKNLKRMNKNYSELFSQYERDKHTMKTRQSSIQEKRLTILEKHLPEFTGNKKFKKSILSDNKKLTSSLVINKINHNMLNNIKIQQNPEMFFKNEFKMILSKHLEKETDDQVVKIIDIFMPILSKKNLKGAFKNYVKELSLSSEL